MDEQVFEVSPADLVKAPFSKWKSAHDGATVVAIGCNAVTAKESRQETAE